MPKKAKWADVACEKHGVERDGIRIKQVRVGLPKNKNDRGCPRCEAERKLSEK